MLALTKKTDYALIAIARLAHRNGDVVSAREIAEQSAVPLPILTNILKSLSHGGLVVSERGARGGYSLARPAEEITLDELITAIEGPIHFVRCMFSESEASNGACTLEPSCPVRVPAFRVQERLKEFLQSVTLADLGVAPSPPAAVSQIKVEPTAPRRATVGDFVR
ncbi:MAG: Rrf2 family transcriptional regulator [Planctomycetes bacterium]|nr:Rrf2 family transcriptional regulator [Planctomycetota bacterium]